VETDDRNGMAKSIRPIIVDGKLQSNWS